MDRSDEIKREEREAQKRILRDGGRRHGSPGGQLAGAGRSVLRNSRSYINFMLALFLIQTLLCLLMTGAELDMRTAYAQVSEHYDYHMMLRGMSQPQYAELHNLDAEIPYDMRPFLPYTELRYERMENGEYNAYFTLRGDDPEAERQQIQSGLLDDVSGIDDALVVSYSPLYDYHAYYERNIRVETGWSVLALLVLSLYMLMTLYNARLNHERFQYGIYMTCGAGFRQLFMTASGEMLTIAGLTYLPSVLAANAAILLLYRETGTAFSLRPLPIVITAMLGVVVAWISVYVPMKRLAAHAPVALLSAQDNSNLVTSPRRSLHIFGRSFPLHYEIFSLWRYRRYLAGLLVVSTLFTGLWLGLIRISDFRAELQRADAPEFTVAFHPETPDADILNENVELLSREIELLPGVDRCTYEVSTGIMQVRGFMAVTSHAARHAGAYTVRYESDEGSYGAATNACRYVALNEDTVRRLTETYEHIEGDVTSVLKSSNYVILSTALHNAERFDFAPGDTVLLATNLRTADSTVYPMNNLDTLRTLIAEEEFLLEEYTVGAVIHDEAAGDKLMIGVDHDTYRSLTATEPYTTMLDVYLVEDMDFALLKKTEDGVSDMASWYYTSTVTAHHAFFTRYLNGFRNEPLRIVTAAYLVLAMMPLLCFFSQRIFYGKRQKEWYILRALGASRSERLRLLLLSGALLMAINLAAMLPVGLFADFIAFKMCNEWLPAGGFIPSVLMQYRVLPAIVPVMLLFAAINGFIPCLLEYIRMKRSIAAEDAMERALEEERAAYGKERG